MDFISSKNTKQDNTSQGIHRSVPVKIKFIIKIFILLMLKEYTNIHLYIFNFLNILFKLMKFGNKIIEI